MRASRVVTAFAKLSGRGTGEKMMESTDAIALTLGASAICDLRPIAVLHGETVSYQKLRGEHLAVQVTSLWRRGFQDVEGTGTFWTGKHRTPSGGHSPTRYAVPGRHMMRSIALPNTSLGP